MTTTAPHAARSPRPPAGPSPDTVVLLQSVRSYPSVSLLATTTPARRMSATDARIVSRLAGEAIERLRAEPAGEAEAVVRALDATVAHALAGPTGRAIAIFVSAAMQEVVCLPVPVTDRVVVDPTFATRDLVRGLHRAPRHVVLLLTEREARLLEGSGDRHTPPASSNFPITAPATPEQRTRQAVEGFLRQVDRALGTYLRLHPAPLVLVGAERTLAEFRRLSRNTGRLAGVVTGSLSQAPLSDLAPRIRVVLEEYLLSRQDEALNLIDQRRSRGKVVDGVAAAWLAARAEHPEMLAIEESLVYPARISEDGDFLSPADDTDHPDVIDDAVDELIELVIQRGGWVSFVADGLLDKHERVVLTLR
jgi:Bacterial archaeo-eukaryotic release factor family 3